MGENTNQSAQSSGVLNCLFFFVCGHFDLYFFNQVHLSYMRNFFQRLLGQLKSDLKQLIYVTQTMSQHKRQFSEETDKKKSI